MKIGILTYHRAHNYGALLQAYSSRTFMTKLGHQVEMIDYWPNKHADDYKLFPNFRARSLLGKIKSILLFPLGYTRFLKRSNKYKKFIREQFSLSDVPKYLNKKDLKGLEYDVVVYGSDQIWRRSTSPDGIGFSSVYFGDYPMTIKRKIAYAASMGVVDINEKDKYYLKKKLQNFASISVREDDLRLIVENVMGNPVPLVLDPVFLLSKEEWVNIIPSTATIPQEKYIFFYQLTASKDAIAFTNQLKSKYGYKVIEIRGRVEPLLFSDRYLQTEGPFDFISLIQNAEIVVSTSFHGVALALLFEKQCYALGMKNNSARVQTLLNNLDIPNQFVADINKSNLIEKIDYSQVNPKLANLKLQSQEYLITALGENK